MPWKVLGNRNFRGDKREGRGAGGPPWDCARKEEVVNRGDLYRPDGGPRLLSLISSFNLPHNCLRHLLVSLSLPALQGRKLRHQGLSCLGHIS